MMHHYTIHKTIGNGKIQAYVKKHKKIISTFRISFTFARLLKAQLCKVYLGGPFVYRLGHRVFIPERGVRFPYGLQKGNHYLVAFFCVGKM